MTEKRFEKVVYGEEDECGRAWKIVDNATDKEYTKPYMIVDCMNELADENEQLKQFIDDLYKQYTDNCGSPTDYSNWIFNR